MDFGTAALDSPDVAAVLQIDEATHCRFNSFCGLPQTSSYEDLLKAQLRFRSKTGNELIIDSPWKEVLKFDAFWNQKTMLSAFSKYGQAVNVNVDKLDIVSDSEQIFRAATSCLQGKEALEIGSRARSGITRRHLFEGMNYTGFDILPGENVDVVGDAHQLENYFAAESFDLVVSISVFEHLAIPMQVVQQINHILKLGGMVMVNTHQSWPVHDEPADFHRFSTYTWHQLFNKNTGFELIEAVMGEPCHMVPTSLSPHYIGLSQEKGYLATRCIARKTATTGPIVDIYSLLSPDIFYPN